MRYRFKGIVRSTGQFVEGHAHGETPDEAYNALSEHGIVTEGLVPDPEPINLNAAAQPFSSAIDSALDTAASQVPFDALADKFKGKQVWVLDRDKIRKRVSQVVDQALTQAIANAPTGGGGLNAMDVRHQVAEAISGLFKDNKNLTSQVSGSTQALDGQLKRLEAFLGRAESLLAQMTVAISKIGSGGWGGGGGGGRRASVSKEGGGEQNAVLLEIFKENLKLRGISIDEPAGAAGEVAAGADSGAATAVAEAPPVSSAAEGGGSDLPAGPDNA